MLFHISRLAFNWKHMLQPEHLFMNFSPSVLPIPTLTPFTIQTDPNPAWIRIQKLIGLTSMTNVVNQRGYLKNYLRG